MSAGLALAVAPVGVTTAGAAGAALRGSAIRAGARRRLSKEAAVTSDLCHTPGLRSRFIEVKNSAKTVAVFHLEQNISPPVADSFISSSLASFVKAFAQWLLDRNPRFEATQYGTPRNRISHPHLV